MPEGTVALRAPALLPDLHLRRLVHELNTPVGVCAMAASLLPGQIDSMAAELVAPGRQGLDALLAECHETAALLQSSLQLCVQILGNSTRLPADGHGNDSHARLPLMRLKDCLQSVIAIHLARHPGLQVHCTLHIADSLQIHGDSGLWQQVVGNLVANSLLHGFAGRSRGSIRLAGTLLPGRRILLHYYDDGVGLSDAVRERLFEDGFSTRHGSGGSGLGMGIVKDLVYNKMGGKLEVHRPPTGVHISLEASC